MLTGMDMGMNIHAPVNLHFHQLLKANFNLSFLLDLKCDTHAETIAVIKVTFLFLHCAKVRSKFLMWTYRIL
jgi:hypothetical protein